jgi:prepilin-type N-terminal cleavage/methylation domain-containing protein
MRTRGFTLVELLVIIAIVALLAAILFPVFAKAKSKAYAATCASNLKQIGAALAIYSSDWNDDLPSGRDGRKGYGDEADNGPRVADQLAAYGTKGVFVCPADTGALASDTDFGSDLAAMPKAHVKLGSSYFYYFTGYYPECVPLSDVPIPASVAAFWDASGAWHSGERVVAATTTYDDWIAAMKPYQYQTLFFDAHVKLLPHDSWLNARS